MNPATRSLFGDCLAFAWASFDLAKKTMCVPLVSCFDLQTGIPHSIFSSIDFTTTTTTPATPPTPTTPTPPTPPTCYLIPATCYRLPATRYLLLLLLRLSLLRVGRLSLVQVYYSCVNETGPVELKHSLNGIKTVAMRMPMQENCPSASAVPFVSARGPASHEIWKVFIALEINAASCELYTEQYLNLATTKMQPA